MRVEIIANFPKTLSTVMLIYVTRKGSPLQSFLPFRAFGFGETGLTDKGVLRLNRGVVFAR